MCPGFACSYLVFVYDPSLLRSSNWGFLIEGSFFSTEDDDGGYIFSREINARVYMFG